MTDDNEAAHLQTVTAIYQRLHGMGLKLYGPYMHKCGRRNVVVYDSGSQKMRSVAYARVKLECALGRKLSPGMHADHKDEDRSNDHIDNLQEIPSRANKAKSNQRRAKPLPTFTCAVCGAQFLRYAYKVVTATPACSRSCGVIVGHGKR